jgi:hypothetical protein
MEELDLKVFGGIMRTGIRLLALVGLLVSGCAIDSIDTSSNSQAAIGPATITTDASSYTFLTNHTITWAGMPGMSANEYIAIAPQGSPNTSITRWRVTGGGASGMMTLEAVPTAGTYVVRGFGADDSFQGESDPFTVGAAGMATVNSASATYLMTDPIVINWSGMPGNTDDWISIAPQGSADALTTDWLYTNGGTSGTTTFMDGLLPTNYPPGPYVARAFINDSFVKVGESPVFTVMLNGGGATVTTNAASYSIQQAITVTWSGLPGNQFDWIALAPNGSQTTTVLHYVYTNGQAAGMTTFAAGLGSPGSYVARAFENNTYNILGQSAPFMVNAVGGVTVTTNAAAYTLGQPVTVTWMGAPGNANDWVAISPAGSSATTVTRWVYTGGAANGSFAFEGPPGAGMYEARVYLNDSYTVIGTSATFTVN